MNDQNHLAEMKIQLDASHPGHILPPAMLAADMVVEIGCGAGQTLIAAYNNRVTFGLDVDPGAIRLGRSLTQNVRFVCGKAEALPYGNEQFDLVLARGSVPYFNIPASLREMRRVLRPGGTVWMTLHPVAICWTAAKTGNYKGKMFFAYICINSALFHLCQRQFPLLGRYESFQTERGITRALQRLGFVDISVTRGAHFLVTAKAPQRRFPNASSGDGRISLATTQA